MQISTSNRLRHLRRLGAGVCLIFITVTLKFGAPPPAADFRTFDGTGNNLAHPDWGSAGSHLLRSRSGAHYGDGISSLAGAGRPSPRVVSNVLFDQTEPIFSSVGH